MSPTLSPIGVLERKKNIIRALTFRRASKRRAKVWKVKEERREEEETKKERKNEWGGKFIKGRKEGRRKRARDRR